MMNVAHDRHAHEHDMDTLSHKILVNVCLLTNSDRASLFLARGSRGQRYLLAKLFDVTPDSQPEESLEAAEHYGRKPIAFGVGIVGLVAQTKQTIIIKDAYQVRKIRASSSPHVLFLPYVFHINFCSPPHVIFDLIILLR